MNRFRLARWLVCLGLLLAAVASLVGGSAVLAADRSADTPTLLPANQEETQPEEEPITFFAKFPNVVGVANDVFNFEIYIAPKTDEYAVKYDFNVITPPGWQAGVWGSYPKKQVTSIDFVGQRLRSETIEVRASAAPGNRPEPGEYTITLEMVSENYRATRELTAVVIASYGFDMFTETGRTTFQAKAGEDNHISILLVNTGTATIEDMALSTEAPEGWEIAFDPEEIGALEPGLKREVEVIIQPPKKVIAGDYPITLKADSEKAADTLELRVIVLTATVWGWAGVGIAAGVIAGLVVMFRRLGKR